MEVLEGDITDLAPVERAVAGTEVVLHLALASVQRSVECPPATHAACATGTLHCTRKTFTATYGLDTVCLRFFNIFGPRQRADGPYTGVIAIFIDAGRIRQSTSVSNPSFKV